MAKYPKIRVHTGGGGVVEVDHRPSSATLHSNGVMLSGDYRVPKKGEFYWREDELVASKGRVAKCQGRAYNRYHILDKNEPMFMVKMPNEPDFSEVTASKDKQILKEWSV